MLMLIPKSMRIGICLCFPKHDEVIKCLFDFFLQHIFLETDSVALDNPQSTVFGTHEKVVISKPGQLKAKFCNFTPLYIIMGEVCCYLCDPLNCVGVFLFVFFVSGLILMQSTSCDDVAIALQDEIITESVCLSVFFLLLW